MEPHLSATRAFIYEHNEHDERIRIPLSHAEPQSPQRGVGGQESPRAGHTGSATTPTRSTCPGCPRYRRASRTRQAAADGTLAIMVGADPAVFAAIHPVLSTMGTDIVHCGGPGAGTATLAGGVCDDRPQERSRMIIIIHTHRIDSTI